MTDGRFEVFLRFVAGLSSPRSAWILEEFLGKFPHQTMCRVSDWVKGEVKRQIRNAGSEFDKRRLLNTMHYLFESQNPALAQQTLGSVETLSFCDMGLTPIDCVVLSHVIRLCDTMKHLNLVSCHIQCEGLLRLGPVLHKCQRLRLYRVGLTDSGAEDLASSLSTNHTVTELCLSHNSLTDRCVPALRRLILTLPRLELISLWENKFSPTGKKELRSLQEPRPGLRVTV
ncbi:NLR family CARD domain-containing protein 3-like [Amblyraja radiata]|uniref:NLR family CARD domain-containing protein 3-like n=1 Tax=Amblyraja radiata TaxID=386614 RepID=UPI0014034FA9|nr:NLR family CARD domain-containing protein 3-like [Amblyraja radiata]